MSVHLSDRVCLVERTQFFKTDKHQQWLNHNVAVFNEIVGLQ